MKLRIKFRKYGPVRFIGHLDVMRFFQKAIRRAEIDVVYTAGFSPHQVMSFAAPLGLGLESNGEYMDIEINSMTSSKDIINSLNDASVNGIEILSAKCLPETAGNAMASVAAAKYTIRFRPGREPSFDYVGKLDEFTNKSEITVTKTTKKSTMEIDLKPGIFSLKASPDGSISMLVDASSAGNIKPVSLMEAFLADNDEVLAENALLITREDTYTNIGSTEAPQLVSLDEIGYSMP